MVRGWERRLFDSQTRAVSAILNKLKNSQTYFKAATLQNKSDFFSGAAAKPAER